MAAPAPIFADTFSFCEWLLNHLDRDASVLARHLCDNALKLLGSIALALRNRLREERLDDADEHLIALRVQVRLAEVTGLLSESQTLYALDTLDRIGRQLGGWQRTLDQAY